MRDAARARALLGPNVAVFEGPVDGIALRGAIQNADAVVNLAGENILGGRWTRKRKRRLEQSRVELTRDVVDAIAAAKKRPKTFVCASAVGFYGDRGAELLTEEDAPGEGFLSELCADWERAALRARAVGVRVVPLRIGVVLGAHGGALAKMLPAFRAGLGGRIGSGDQYVPWIHLEDMVRVIEHALHDRRYNGVINAVAPNPITNRELTAALSDALGRSARIPVPRLALRAALGRASGVLLASQRVDPRRLASLGFQFHKPTIREALVELSDAQAPAILRRSGPVPTTDYLRRRKPTYQLHQRTRIDAPLDEVFAFFSRAENLGVITPPKMAFRILTPRPIDMADGATIDYRIGVGPIPMTWRTRIESWRPPNGFVDSQTKGPYRSWWHSHTFRADGDQTVMEDRVYYAPPLGLLGRLAHKLFIGRMLRRIFSYRSQAIQLRFPGHKRARRRVA